MPGLASLRHQRATSVPKLVRWTMATTTHYEIRAGRTSVELWLEARIPFEPAGSVLDARNRLRTAIRGLDQTGDQRLVAEYASAATGVFDVENVLLYNVGTGAFSGLAQKGLRVFRTYRMPPPSPSGRAFAYYHRYGFEEVAFKGNEPPPTLSFEPPRLASDTKPHQVWWAASSGSCDEPIQVSDRFSLEIDLSSLPANLAAVVKPLLDGIICAMHPASSVDHVAIDRLARSTGWETHEIARRLQHPAAPVLNVRHVLRSYR